LGSVRTKGKVLIYATSARGLLVFSEPDFPDIPLQVPGGTIDQGETPEAAALREFLEETGLIAPNLHPMGRFDHLAQTIQGPLMLQRHCFHTRLSADLPQTWDHVEQHASDGSGPILFRFHWLGLHRARNDLGLGMAAALCALPA
jgi:8-oxo-dGTP pyrophosphatase MutT (NUDIX family)